MKKFRNLCLMAFACLALTACDKKAAALDDFRDLTNEVTNHSQNYTVDDWRQYLKDYHVVDSVINLYEYTDEEKKEITKMESKCAAYAIKAGAIIAKEELKNIFKGAGQEIQDAIGDTDELLNDVKEGVNEATQKATEAIGTAKDALQGFVDALKQE